MLQRGCSAVARGSAINAWVFGGAQYLASSLRNRPRRGRWPARRSALCLTADSIFPALVLECRFPAAVLFPAVRLVLAGRGQGGISRPGSVLSEYETEVHSPSMTMRLPSVIALKDYIPAARQPAFTRFNVFLRDAFQCQYCGDRYPTHDLTFDHVIPRSRGGRTTWENVVTACGHCNLRKGNKLPREMPHAPALRAAAAHDLGTAGERPGLPAELPARELAGLPVLGQRTGELRHGSLAPAIEFVVLAGGASPRPTLEEPRPYRPTEDNASRPREHSGIRLVEVGEVRVRGNGGRALVTSRPFTLERIQERALLTPKPAPASAGTRRSPPRRRAPACSGP